MAFDHYIENGAQRLRCGYTTGTCAALAAAGAASLLLSGQAPRALSLVTPKGIPVTVEPVELFWENDAAVCGVAKDGGDDADATDGLVIRARVTTMEEPEIRIDGGEGVGRVTKPGLDQPPGAAAINRVPRRMIEEQARRVCNTLGYAGGLSVCISVPGGEEAAKRTFNPMLGIEGGISILGTQGTVRPFSHAAWQASIAQGIAVAEATACPGLGMSTGRRSEKLLMARYPGWPTQSFVQVADFAGFSLEQAGLSSLPLLVWGCFFGKAVKLAQGHASTHAKDAVLDMARLASLCAEQGVTGADALTSCVTAAHALELLLASGPAGVRAVAAVAGEAARTASRFAGRPVRVHIFADDGSELASA